MSSVRVVSGVGVSVDCALAELPTTGSNKLAAQRVEIKNCLVNDELIVEPSHDCQ